MPAPVGLKLSVSQLFTDRCDQKWHYKYRDRLVPARVRPEIDIGRAFHYVTAKHLSRAAHKMGLALGRNTMMPWVEEVTVKLNELDLPSEKIDESLDEIARIQELAYELYRRWIVWFKPAEWEVLSVEEEIEVGIFGGNTFLSVVDFAGRHKEHGAQVIDWKVRETITDVERNQFPLQQMAYQWMYKEKYGIELLLSSLFQIRSTLPKTPNQNKDGQMSRADIVTDWRTYKQALIAVGLDPKDYKDMKGKLADKKFYSFDTLVFDDEQLDAVWNAVILPRCQEIVERSPDYIPKRTGWGSFECARCEYSEKCIADLFGWEADPDIFHTMVTKEKRR